MKKIMFLMAAAMLTFGGINAANAQTKPAAKTEQSKTEKKDKKAHHAPKKHEAKKKEAAAPAQK